MHQQRGFTNWLFRPLTQAIHQLRESLMSAITDLQASVTRLNSSVSAEIAAIAAALAAAGSNDPAINDAVLQLNALADQLDAETAVLTAPPVTP